MGEDILRDLLYGPKDEKEQQLERLENVKKLAEIIHAGRVKNIRSHEIAGAIVRYVKEGKG